MVIRGWGNGPWAEAGNLRWRSAPMANVVGHRPMPAIFRAFERPGTGGGEGGIRTLERP